MTSPSGPGDGPLPSAELSAHGPSLRHEWGYAALFALIGTGLGFQAAAWAAAALWWATALLVVGLPRLCARIPAIWGWRVRLGIAWLLMNTTYLQMGHVVGRLGTPLRDAQLQAVDAGLFGAPLPLLLESWMKGPLPDLISACYLLFFPYLTWSCAIRLWQANRSLRDSIRFFEALFVVYAVGFFGYLMVPAQGAYLDIPDAFRTPLSGGWVFRFNDHLVRAGSNRVDVFPSLHVAVSGTMLGWDLRSGRRWARWLVIPVLGLWAATILLRYHYGIDVMAGFALAGTALAWIRP